MNNIPKLYNIHITNYNSPLAVFERVKSRNVYIVVEASENRLDRLLLIKEDIYNTRKLFSLK